MFQKLKENKAILLGAITIAAFAAVVFLPKVSLEKRLYISAKRHSEKGEWRAAADDYERIVRYTPASAIGIESARLGAGVCLYELKDYANAVFFFRHIVQYSQKEDEIRWAQEKLGEVFYEKLNDYGQAIVEYQRLLDANPAPDEVLEYKLKLGRAYFYMGNFEQAEAEADEALRAKPDVAKKFDILMLKADALIAQKKSDDALDIYNSMETEFKDYPEFYQMKLNKALVYEEEQEWDKAIDELTAIRDKYPQPDVIDLKIKSIERRKAKKRE